MVVDSGAGIPVAQAHPALQAVSLQLLIVAACVGAASALAAVGQGQLARLSFMAGGVMAAAWYARRSPWLYLTLLLWFWTITPFVRRVIEYQGAFDPVNIILATPNLISVLMLRDILLSNHILSRPATGLGMLVVLPCSYGFALDLVQGNITVGLIGAAEWITPLCYYFYVLAHAEQIRSSESTFQAFLALNATIVAGYGLYQYWALPAWDVAWAIASGMQASLAQSPDQFRVFGTLNSPGVLSPWLVALALLAIQLRNRLMIVALPAVLFLLALSLVRSSVGCLALSLAVAGLLGWLRLRTLGAMVVAIAVVALILAAVDSSTVERLAARLDSVGNLETDGSALARQAIWQGAPAVIDAHPFGMGLGSLGRGAVVTGVEELIVIDAGPLSVYLSLGWVPGTIYLVGLFAVVGWALVVARRNATSAAPAWALAALSSLLALPFVNVTGFAGVTLWLSAGCAVAYGVRAVDGGRTRLDSGAAARHPPMIR